MNGGLKILKYIACKINNKFLNLNIYNGYLIFTKYFFFQEFGAIELANYPIIRTFGYY